MAREGLTREETREEFFRCGALLSTVEPSGFTLSGHGNGSRRGGEGHHH